MNATDRKKLAARVSRLKEGEDLEVGSSVIRRMPKVDHPHRGIYRVEKPGAAHYHRPIVETNDARRAVTVALDGRDALFTKTEVGTFRFGRSRFGLRGSRGRWSIVELDGDGYVLSTPGPRLVYTFDSRNEAVPAIEDYQRHGTAVV